MLSADTNIFVYAADPDSPRHEAARAFLLNCREDFAVCQLVLVELYMLLRNPVVFKRPYSASEAAGYCNALAESPHWKCLDYEPPVVQHLWAWASHTAKGYRGIIDARLALTLRHHGVTRFATFNTRDFQGFGFIEVWDPLTPIFG